MGPAEGGIPKSCGMLLTCLVADGGRLLLAGNGGRKLRRWRGRVLGATRHIGLALLDAPPVLDGAGRRV